jgi:acetyl esterase/lipase
MRLRFKRISFRRFDFPWFLDSRRRVLRKSGLPALLVAAVLLGPALLKCASAEKYPQTAAQALNAGAAFELQRAVADLAPPRIPALNLASIAPAVGETQEPRRSYAIYRDLIYGYSSGELQVASEKHSDRDPAVASGFAPGTLLADVYVPNASEDSADSRNAGLRDSVANAHAPRPAVVIIHGGSWQRGDRARMARIAGGLADAGFVAVNIEYSLAPRYRFPAQLHDCRAAVLWIREHAAALNVDPERIGAFGYSAGGHLALLLATTGRSQSDPARIQAVVAGAPPANLAAMPGPADRTLRRLLGADREEAPELYRQASPVAHVSADDPPAFLYHGRYDWVVPFTQSEDMARRLRAAGVTVELLAGEGGHVSSAPFRDEVPVGLLPAIEFLKRHL